MNLEKEIFELSLEDIMPNRFQPREIFEDEALLELANSIKEHGIIQPIIVRKVGDKYEIVAGERRYRASKLAGQTTIPALIRNIDDKEAAKVALLENLQRRDLSPIEEAKTYQTILKLENLTQDELAETLGKSQGSVANKLRLLNLAEEVQTALLNNEISERHARSLLALDKEEQVKLLNKIITERLTVKALDDEIAKINNVSVVPEPQEETTETATSESEIQEEQPKPNIFDALRIENKVPTENEEEQPETEDQEIESEEQEEENLETLIKTIDKDLEEQKTEEKEEIKKEPNPEKNPQPQEEPKVQETEQEENKEEQPEPINDTSKYDLRFAINNFRQAIQNTEKFGFNVKAEEFENDENYQLIITIKKKS